MPIIFPQHWLASGGFALLIFSRKSFRHFLFSYILHCTVGTYRTPLTQYLPPPSVTKAVVRSKHVTHANSECCESGSGIRWSFDPGIRIRIRVKFFFPDPRSPIQPKIFGSKLVGDGPQRMFINEGCMIVWMYLLYCIKKNKCKKSGIRPPNL